MRSTFDDYDQEQMDAIDQRVDDVVHRFQQQLGELDGKHLTVYCLSCCERLLPNYGAFQKATGVGDFHLFCNLMDKFWRSAAGEGGQFTEQLTELAQIDFILDEQSNELAMYASDAVSLAEVALTAYPQCSEGVAAQCYRIVLEGLVRYLLSSCLELELAFSKAANFIFSSSEWNCEVELHEKIKEYLKSTRELSGRDVSELCMLAINNGFSNIGLQIADSKKRWCPAHLSAKGF